MRRTVLLLAATALIAATPVTAAERVLFPPACTTPEYKPTSIILTCADANLRIARISWERWGSHSAKGAGTVVANTCEPNCAEGKFERFPGVTVTLSAVRRCKGSGKLQFTRVTYAFAGERPSGLDATERFPFGCGISAGD